jgi:P27 family predicted phage terminase small subunit
MSGPPRTPTQTRKAKGNPGKRAYNKREPKLPAGAPPVPEGLDEVATLKWKQLVAVALKAQVLTEAEGAILELAARAYSTWRRAEEEVAENGLTYESVTEDGGRLIKANPAATIAADAWRRYRAAVCELGFTPAARSKVSTVEPSENENPGAAFFN